MYNNSRITSGVYMCAVGVAMGYKNIYLAGIDFYSGGSNYAFDTKRDNLVQLAPDFIKEKSHGHFHNKEIDVAAMKFLKEHYRVNFFSLCNNSECSEEFELAPIVSSKTYTPQIKNTDATKDIMIPPKESYLYKNFYYGVQSNIISAAHKINMNPILRLCKALMTFPNDFKMIVIKKIKQRIN